jgi:hypothetical protein
MGQGPTQQAAVGRARWSQSPHLASCALWLLAGLVTVTSVMADRTVTELQPSEVSAFVRQNPKVVVQFTSPDVRCGYCVGAERQFVEGVARSGKEGWAYITVQWPRWIDMPTLAPPVKVWGLPDHQIYEGGQFKGSAGGRANDPAALMASIEALHEQTAPTAKAASAPPSAAFTPELRSGLRFYALRKVLGGAIHDCDRQLHGNKPFYAPRLHGWTELHAEALTLGTQAMFSILGVEQHPYRYDMEQQAALVRAKLAKDLGMLEGQPATLAQCEHLADSLGRF